MNRWVDNISPSGIPLTMLTVGGVPENSHQKQCTVHLVDSDSSSNYYPKFTRRIIPTPLFSCHVLAGVSTLPVLHTV